MPIYFYRNVFLSTPSGWRATDTRLQLCEHGIFLSTPSGWRATIPYIPSIPYLAFLSTPSGWRATLSAKYRTPCRVYFYPRPPGGGRRFHHVSIFIGFHISIHALRVEGDPRPSIWRGAQKGDFYPRPPGGGRRKQAGFGGREVNFYPRPPGGGRQMISSPR